MQEEALYFGAEEEEEMLAEKQALLHTTIPGLAVKVAIEMPLLTRMTASVDQ